MVLNQNKYKKWILAAVIAAVLTGCGGAEERQEKYLERAQELFDKGDFDKARIEAKNVLQINANNAKARLLMAELNENDRNWPQMYAELSVAIEADPKLTAARVKFIQLLIASGQLDKAAEQIAKIQEYDPNNADAFAMRGILLMRQDKTDEAIAEAEKALKAEPGHVSATGLLANHYLETDPAKAEQLVAAGLKVNPKNTVLQMMQIKVFSKQDKNDDVITAFQKLIADNPDNLMFPAQFASFYLSLKRVDDAEAMLRQVVERKPDSDEAKFLLVDFLTKQRTPDIARTQLEQYSAAAPDNYKLRSALGRFYVATRDADKAIATYQYTIDKEKRSADGIDARNRVTELLLVQNKRAEADEMIKSVLELEPENVDALLMRARLLLSDDKPNDAIADLRSVLKNSPDSAVALSMMASAQERTGAFNLALDNYKKLLERNPENVLALTGAGRLLLAQDQVDEARKLLEQAEKADKGNTEATRLLVEVYTRKKQWDQALALCNGLLINQKTAPMGHHLAGLVHARMQDFPAAIEDFKKALEKEPRAVEPLQMLTNAYVVNKQADQAVSYLEKHLKAYPEQVHAQEILGALYHSTGKLPAAEKLLTDLVQKQPARVTAYRELAGLYMTQKEPEKVEALFKRGLELNPTNDDFMLLLAQYYQSSNKDQQALEMYNQLQQRQPQSVAVKNNLAVILIDKFPTEDNLRRAQTLTAEFANSDNPIFLDTAGWLQYRMKNYPQAIALLENAVRKSNGIPELRYHLGMAYLKGGKADKAKEELSKALSTSVRFFGREEAETTLSAL